MTSWVCPFWFSAETLLGLHSIPKLWQQLKTKVRRKKGKRGCVDAVKDVVKQWEQAAEQRLSTHEMCVVYTVKSVLLNVSNSHLKGFSKPKGPANALFTQIYTFDHMCILQRTARCTLLLCFTQFQSINLEQACTHALLDWKTKYLQASALPQCSPAKHWLLQGSKPQESIPLGADKKVAALLIHKQLWLTTNWWGLNKAGLRVSHVETSPSSASWWAG